MAKDSFSDMTYRINEIFYSLQGEGFNTGTPSVFVRFSGCNLRCTFCDTKHEEGMMMTADEIAKQIKEYPQAQLVVLTGGEPSLFIDEEFVDYIKKECSKPIAIETNGTNPLPKNLDWVTLSPKTGFDGGNTKPCILTDCNELKVVYLGQDLGQYDRIKAQFRYLQPCYTDNETERPKNLKACVEAVMQNEGWRLSLQIHRMLGIR